MYECGSFMHSLTKMMDILRGLPEGSRLRPTLFGICVAELILELRAKFPLLQFHLITSIDDLNWIGAFLYVDDMVLIARSPSQLQSMIDACQDWAERSRMRINQEKTEVMMFYETPSQRTTRFASTFHITTRFPRHDLRLSTGRITNGGSRREFSDPGSLRSKGEWNMDHGRGTDNLRIRTLNTVGFYSLQHQATRRRPHRTG